MGDYRRSTRECTFDRLRPELVEAIRAHAQQHDLGDVEHEALICCETTNEKIKSGGLFGKLLGGDPDRVHYSGLVVTPRWLIWATSGAKRGTTVLSNRLHDTEVHDIESMPYNELMKDTGLEVTAFFTGRLERAQAFIGLGPEPAAQNVRSVLKDALRKAAE
jgi:hypothetical protein